MSMIMDEIWELERKMREQALEAQMQTIRYEATNKAIQDMLNAFWMIHSAQMKCLIYAGLNPNFCKPKDVP
jgi:hypothetical protein